MGADLNVVALFEAAREAAVRLVQDPPMLPGPPCRVWSILVYVVYLVIYDSGWVTLRHLLVLCPPPPFQPTNPESINPELPRCGSPSHP